MSKNSIIPFEFEGNEFQAIIGDDGEPRFMASHVCKALEIRNVAQALSRLDDDEKGIILNDTPSIRGATPFSTVTEAGLYRLIFSSRKKSAENFKRWIAHDVLPEIRKRGGYISPNATPEQIKALQVKIADLEQALHWFGVKTGAGRFLEQSLPDGDKD